eukprot:3315329-Prymnesium_polylepis.1
MSIRQVARGRVYAVRHGMVDKPGAKQTLWTHPAHFFRPVEGRLLALAKAAATAGQSSVAVVGRRIGAVELPDNLRHGEVGRRPLPRDRRRHVGRRTAVHRGGGSGHVEEIRALQSNAGSVEQQLEVAERLGFRSPQVWPEVNDEVVGFHVLIAAALVLEHISVARVPFPGHLLERHMPILQRNGLPAELQVERCVCPHGMWGRERHLRAGWRLAPSSDVHVAPARWAGDGGSLGLQDASEVTEGVALRLSGPNLNVYEGISIPRPNDVREVMPRHRRRQLRQEFEATYKADRDSRRRSVHAALHEYDVRLGRAQRRDAPTARPGTRLARARKWPTRMHTPIVDMMADGRWWRPGA